MQFGINLAQAMKLKGFTQDQLSEISGVSQGTISRYLNNRAAPKAAELHKLASALGVRMEWLLTGEGEPSAAGGDGGEQPTDWWLFVASTVVMSLAAKRDYPSDSVYIVGLRSLRKSIARSISAGSTRFGTPEDRRETLQKFRQASTDEKIAMLKIEPELVDLVEAEPLILEEIEEVLAEGVALDQQAQ